jgi:hypothetical protein
MLDGLAPHPRLLLSDDRAQELKTLAATDPLLADLVEVVRVEAVKALGEPVIQRRLDDPGASEERMKDERRAAMYRVFNLGVTMRLTDDPVLAQQMADRIKAELLAAAGFSDWYPSHFLNVGEMSAWMAVGYDWVYPQLTPAERTTIRDGIVRNGLDPGSLAYANHGQFTNWPTSENNWNQVCNAGLSLAALAVADGEPAKATAVLEKAVVSIGNSMVNFDPDGAWNEGPTYWAYGTTYAALMASGLRSALGDPRGMEELDGYDSMGKSGAFHIQTVGGANRYFNFGDSKPVAYFSPVLFWLAGEFQQPAYAFYERLVASNDLARMRSGALMADDTLDRFLALLVVWYDPSGQAITYDDLPLDQNFRGSASVAAMRGSWTDPDAIYLGFKGGDNQSPHGHLDVGGFVLDALGVRWAADLGGDTYELPGYFEFGQTGRRWNYFRLNNRGHNTLTIDNQIQRANAIVPVSVFESTPELAHASMDLTAAYAPQVTSARRGFALLDDRRRVLVQDRLTGLAAGAAVRWGMLTPATVALQGATAILTQDGRSLEARILEPAGAVFTEKSANPLDDPGANPGQNPNVGTTMLAVERTAAASGTVEIVVLLTPVVAGAETLPDPDFRPLDPPPPVVDGTARLGPTANAFVRAGAAAATK